MYAGNIFSMNRRRSRVSYFRSASNDGKKNIYADSGWALVELAKPQTIFNRNQPKATHHDPAAAQLHQIMHIESTICDEFHDNFCWRVASSKNKGSGWTPQSFICDKVERTWNVSKVEMHGSYLCVKIKTAGDIYDKIWYNHRFQKAWWIP